MEVFDQNNSFQMINYCLMDFGIFVLFFCILVLIPHLIPRFVTFTQKKKKRIPLRHYFFNIFYTLVRFTPSKFPSKSDNCGSAAVNFWA